MEGLCGMSFVGPTSVDLDIFLHIIPRELVRSEEETIYAKGLSTDLHVLSMHMTSSRRSFNEVTYYVMEIERVRGPWAREEMKRQPDSILEEANRDELHLPTNVEGDEEETFEKDEWIDHEEETSEEDACEWIDYEETSEENE
uniref:Uncharacterized protein n=1 Tax=Solanum tuberosum TaxID=4113 RepID=M1DQD4_SOLTU